MNSIAILDQKNLEIVKKLCPDLKPHVQICATEIVERIANQLFHVRPFDFCTQSGYGYFELMALDELGKLEELKALDLQWTPIKFKDFQHGMGNKYSLPQIKKALAALIEAEILERRSHPYRSIIKTYQYKINSKVAISTLRGEDK